MADWPSGTQRIESVLARRKHRIMFPVFAARSCVLSRKARWGTARVTSPPMEDQSEIYKMFYEALATQRRFNKAAKFKDLHAIGAPG